MACVASLTRYWKGIAGAGFAVLASGAGFPLLGLWSRVTVHDLATLMVMGGAGLVMVGLLGVCVSGCWQLRTSFLTTRGALFVLLAALSVFILPLAFEFSGAIQPVLHWARIPVIVVLFSGLAFAVGPQGRASMAIIIGGVVLSIASGLMAALPGRVAVSSATTTFGYSLVAVGLFGSMNARDPAGRADEPVAHQHERE